MAYISEPLNVLHRPGVFSAHVPHWYNYITSENEAEFLPAFRQLLDYDYHVGAELRAIRSRKDLLRMVRDFHSFFIGSMQAERPLLKDPFAVFSTPWFVRRLDCQIVVTVRHPAGFASSLKRLGWSFDFQNLLEQPLLMRDYLEADRADMEQMPADDIIGQAALLWRLIYRTVDSVRSKHPEFQIVRHEDFSADPVRCYRELYAALGLKFTPRVENLILKSSSSENPRELSRKHVHAVKLDSRANMQNWKKRLEPAEITRIRALTESVSHLFYPEDGWR